MILDVCESPGDFRSTDPHQAEGAGGPGGGGVGMGRLVNPMGVCIKSRREPQDAACPQKKYIIIVSYNSGQLVYCEAEFAACAAS